MLQALSGIVNARAVAPPLKNGPPNGPFAFRVSAMRHGVAATKWRPGADGPTQLGNLNEPMCVCQLKSPLVIRYSLEYQKVQSSIGSMLMLVYSPQRCPQGPPPQRIGTC